MNPWSYEGGRHEWQNRSPGGCGIVIVLGILLAIGVGLKALGVF
jgi:hypothetical protein